MRFVYEKWFLYLVVVICAGNIILQLVTKHTLFAIINVVVVILFVANWLVAKKEKATQKTEEVTSNKENK